MAAKFYYVLAFERGQGYQVDSETRTLVYQPQFLGKTSDLSFLVEAEKTVDMDDGSTEVGSEKLSLSFNVLSKVTNPVPLSQVWLIPVIGHSTGWEEGEGPRVPILKVFFKDSEDYRLEVKSGEFEVTKFSAVLRYSVDNPAFEYDDRFFVENRLWLAEWGKDFADDEVGWFLVGGRLVLDVHNYRNFFALEVSDRVCPRSACIMEYLSYDYFEYDYPGLGIFVGSGPSLRGVCVVSLSNMSEEEDNIKKFLKDTSEAFQADLATYAMEWGKTNYPGTPFDVLFTALTNFAEANPNMAELRWLVMSDLLELFPNLCTVKGLVQAGYLPELGDWESLTANME